MYEARQNKEKVSRRIDAVRGNICQRKLIIISSPNSPFNNLYHDLQSNRFKGKKINPQIYACLNHYAMSDKNYTFRTWGKAIKKATTDYRIFLKLKLNEPLELAKKANELRKQIVENKDKKAEQAKQVEQLSLYVDIYNAGKMRNKGKPQFKSPETKANALLKFDDIDNTDFDSNFIIRNVKGNYREFYPKVEHAVEPMIVEPIITEWAEDHLNDFGNLQSTTLPVYDNNLLKKYLLEKRKKDANEKTLISETSNTTYSSIVPFNNHVNNHVFLKSVVDGGNMLPAPEFAIIGKDSLIATQMQNGLNEEKAKELIAKEYGYRVEQLCFVEQPHYHIDLMMMLLGGNNVLIKPYNGDINLEELTIKDLQNFNNPRLNVKVDYEGLAANQKSDKSWEYNFFNGEYVYGKNNKLYYITNGTINLEAENKFREYMKKETKVEDVIFSRNINTELLNKYNGGLGCRFKGLNI